MTKIFEVTLTVSVLVAAESEELAEKRAHEERSEIISDFAPGFECGRQITSVADLEKVCGGKWTGDCLPYGDNEEKTLFDWLDVVEPGGQTERCDKTIDMFEAGEG